MKWSKLRQILKGNLHESVSDRIDFHITRYTTGSHFMARAWLTCDGIEVANFSLPENYSKFGWNMPEMNERIPQEERKEDNWVEKGEFSNDEFTEACWAFLSLNINDAIVSENPIIQSLAVLDKRVGKRRILKLKEMELHPMVEKILKLRLEYMEK